jgi:excisionase family DNA binding protein
MTQIDTRSAPAATPVLLTMEQVALRLNTTPRFVRRLVAERRIPYLKVGRHVRIDAADVDDFVESARVQPRERPSGRGNR